MSGNNTATTFFVICAAIGALAAVVTGSMGSVEAQPAPPLPPARFVVVSQEFADSGAKVIVLRDTRQPKRKCYVIYEAGAGVVLDKDVPCE